MKIESPAKIVTNLGKISVHALYATVLLLLSSYIAYDVFAPVVSGGFLKEFTLRAPVKYVDFMEFYLAGRVTLSPDAHSIYDRSVANTYFEKVTGLPKERATKYLLEYPPFFFLFFSLIALMPVGVGFLAWSWGTFGLGVSGLFRLTKQLGFINSKHVTLAILAAFASASSWRTFYLGHASWYFIGVICLYYSFFLSKRDIWAAICLSAISVKPHYALFMSVPALAGKRVKLILTAALIDVTLLAVCVGVYGWQNVIGYPAHLQDVELSYDAASMFPISLMGFRGFLSSFLPIVEASRISAGIMFAALIFLIWLWRKALLCPESYRDRLQTWAFSITALLCLLTSMHSQMYDFVILVVPAVLTVPTISIWDAGRLRPPTLLIWTYLLLLYPLLSWAFIISPVFTGPTRLHLLSAVDLVMFLVALDLIKPDKLKLKENIYKNSSS